MKEIQPTQPSTIAIRTSRHVTKNCNRTCLSANAFLPTLKTNYSETTVPHLKGFWIVKNE